MKTKLLQIRRTAAKAPVFTLTITPSYMERDDEPTQPAPVGFYHANAEEPDALALKKLKSAMLNSIDSQIKGLKEDRAAIMAVTLSELPARRKEKQGV
jgi:hypothetical protein